MAISLAKSRAIGRESIRQAIESRGSREFLAETPEKIEAEGCSRDFQWPRHRRERQTSTLAIA